MKLKATVILSIHNQSSMLARAAHCALEQTVEDIEVLVIGNRTTGETRQIVARLEDEDERVTFVHPSKGGRHGAVEALKQARGEMVCYLADHDLWLPNHVECMDALLKHADFAHALPLCVEPSGIIAVWPMDCTLPHDRESMLDGRNPVPLSCGAHTLALHRKLPKGRRTVAEGTDSGACLWQSFLRGDTCRIASGTRPTVLHFPGSQRTDWTASQRLIELDAWAANLNDPQWQQEFLLEVLDTVVRDRAAGQANGVGGARTMTERVDPAHGSLNAWLRDRIRRVPLVGRAIRSRDGVATAAQAP